MSANVALTTLALGEATQSYWKAHCQWNWAEYARLHGYGLHVITEPLDRSDRSARRSPAWQKCLLLGHPELQGYRQVVLLDADVAINPQRTPAITDYVPEDKVGGVISGAYIHDDLKMLCLERLRTKTFAFCSDRSDWNAEQRRFYEAYGLSPMFSEIIQTGVLVASPARHREIFEGVYARDYAASERDYEQVPLSHEILRRDLLCRLNSRFNTVFYERLAVHYPYLLNKQLPNFAPMARIAVFVEWSNSFFLHFAYDRDFARFLPRPEDVKR
ncbi:MAG: hypothetical protein FJ398_09650 [Verrucomicrobia bacterium]|nr:hypothetical protein [Verrucomicrobiota bacterium]